TTMLASESLAIADEVCKSMVLRYGADAIDQHFRSFDTICSATQERQDAILEMMKDPPDIMVVIGGYNSSNTNHLAHSCRQFTTTYHIADAGCIHDASRAIRHKAELDGASPDDRGPDWPTSAASSPRRITSRTPAASTSAPAPSATGRSSTPRAPRSASPTGCPTDPSASGSPQAHRRPTTRSARPSSASSRRQASSP